MNQLHISYRDLQEMPWEYVDWFYNRHSQYLIDLEEEQNRRMQGGY